MADPIRYDNVGGYIAGTTVGVILGGIFGVAGAAAVAGGGEFGFSATAVPVFGAMAVILGTGLGAAASAMGRYGGNSGAISGVVSSSVLYGAMLLGSVVGGGFGNSLGRAGSVESFSGNFRGEEVRGLVVESRDKGRVEFLNIDGSWVGLSKLRASDLKGARGEGKSKLETIRADYESFLESTRVQSGGEGAVGGS